MTPIPNYTDAINALAARQAEEALAAADAAAAQRKRNAAEAEELMRPLTAVMESHPDIERISDISNGGSSPFRRSYRRRYGSGRSTASSPSQSTLRASPRARFKSRRTAPPSAT